MGSQLIAPGRRGSSELQGLHQHRWKVAFACRGLLQTSSKSGCGGLEVVTNSFPTWVGAAKVSREAPPLTTLFPGPFHTELGWPGG